MKLLSRISLVLLLTATLVLPHAGASELTPHHAVYKVKISLLSGQLNTELSATDSGYVATHQVKPTGMSRVIARGAINASSTFSAGSNGIRPVAYHAVDTIGKDPVIDITFDWSSNQARGTVGEEAVLMQLDDIVHDNVSIQYQLMHDLLNGEADSTYVLFDVDEMRVANVRNIGTRQVATRAGNYEVIGIQHQKEGSSRTTTLWCAAELDYLPVIIEQHRKGKLKFQAKLTSYTAD